jgi:heat shock protein HslJ
VPEAVINWRAAAACALVIAGAGCSGQSAPPESSPAGTVSTVASTAPLAGTSWRLVDIRSMDDAVGTTRPSDPSVYTMQLQADGQVSMRLNCNRATGTWTAMPGADSTSGRFEFGPLAMTRALCPAPSLDEQIASQAQYIRSYFIRDGKLSLSLMADGGIWTWEPLAELQNPH